ncbi:MAG: HAD-IC family P-type ATPase [Gammaproteobacteria bacterium]|nr:HAD-IC family P-type ATPase [Gammaproteobacteria bacterium]
MSPATIAEAAAAVQEPWSLDAQEVASRLRVDAEAGLTSTDAERRRNTYGDNRLRGPRRRAALAIFIDQFKSIVILLLAVAGTLAIFLADHVEGLAIFAVIAINTAIGFVTEWRAVRSMEALSHLGTVDTTAMRDGVLKKIPAVELVPGDIVVFEGGDIVTADIRLLEAAKLQANESTLTGESMPVSKSVDAISAETPLVGRINTVYKGTAITRGSGKGVVVGTGFNTELGRITELVTTAEAAQTPLEKRLDALAHRLVWIVVLLAILIAAGGVIVGRELMLAIEVAIALAVAAIPEGLPIVATIALARGMWRMAQRNALIARLSAVETLGATSIILTDKTGTLTENEMLVTAARVADASLSVDMAAAGPAQRFFEDGKAPSLEVAENLDELLRTGVLCSNASVTVLPDGELEKVGDPTEIALLVAGLWRGIERSRLLESLPEMVELAFDPDNKRMATIHQDGGAVLVAVKGAPEAIIPLCSSVRHPSGDADLDDDKRQAWLRHAGDVAARGLRTLAIARKSAADSSTDAYAGLCLLGIVGLEDPPRQGVREAIAACHAAGIDVVMVTGDHAATARQIAIDTGIADDTTQAELYIDGIADADRLESALLGSLGAARVFSRVSPEQKLRLIDQYQQGGKIVAMTGDGVNDAPALRKADIGVAMGVRGTDVAREAAAMVLQDDEFRTIVEAVHQGRAIYANIRKFVIYLLSCNMSEVLVVALATIAGAPLPLLPLQILFLNLVTDVFPALALGVGEGSSGLMREKPRPADEPVLTRAHWLRIAFHGTVIALTVLAAMALAQYQLGFDTTTAVTVSFCTLALAQVWHVFNMRDDMRRVFDNEITRNPWVWAAVSICLALIAAAVFTPLMSSVLQLTNPGASGWLLIVAMSLVPLAVAPLVRRLLPLDSGP